MQPNQFISLLFAFFVLGGRRLRLFCLLKIHTHWSMTADACLMWPFVKLYNNFALSNLKRNLFRSCNYSQLEDSSPFECFLAKCRFVVDLFMFCFIPGKLDITRWTNWNSCQLSRRSWHFNYVIDNGKSTIYEWMCHCVQHVKWLTIYLVLPYASATKLLTDFRVYPDLRSSRIN